MFHDQKGAIGQSLPLAKQPGVHRCRKLNLVMNWNGIAMGRQGAPSFHRRNRLGKRKLNIVAEANYRSATRCFKMHSSILKQLAKPEVVI